MGPGREIGPATSTFRTAAGEVRVAVTAEASGFVATLRSVPPHVRAADAALVEEVLEAMRAHGLTTVAYLWPDPAGTWHARNLFPVGGVVEEAATGAAAAAFGAYLRADGHLVPPVSFDIVQGENLDDTTRASPSAIAPDNEVLVDQRVQPLLTEDAGPPVHDHAGGLDEPAGRCGSMTAAVTPSWTR